jgi:hypothetical protein
MFCICYRTQKRELGLAMMLLCVVTIFFLCNVLALVVNILEVLVHCKKGLAISPSSPAGMSLTKLFLGGNNDVIYKLFPARESLVSDIPAGDGKIANLFLQSTPI